MKRVFTTLLLAVACFCHTFGSVEVTYKRFSTSKQEAVNKIMSNEQNRQYGYFSAIDTSAVSMMTLVVDEACSIYEIWKDEEIVDDEAPQVLIVGDGFSQEDYTVFKDLEGQRMKINEEFIGEKFLIADTLTFTDWKLANESRDILGKKCYKATCDSVVAWYCPEIPIQDGPDVYCGLPGLIVELSDGENRYECVSVKYNSGKVVKEPMRGRKTTREKLDRVKKDFFDQYRK